MPLAKVRSHHSIKNIFKREPTPDKDVNESGGGLNSTSSSHVGLSKFFHHTKESPPTDDSLFQAPIRSPSLSLRRQNSTPNRLRSQSEHIPSAISPPTSKTHHHHQHSHSQNQPQVQHQPVPHHPKKLSKAQTFAHLQQINTKNAAQQQLRNSRLGSNQSTTPTGGGAGHAEKIVYNPYGLNKDASVEKPRNTSFYLSGVIDGERVLANPVADPNDYLPEELKQEHVNLLDDFDIDVSTKKLGAGGSSDVKVVTSAKNKKLIFALKKFTLLSKETDEDFYKRVSTEYVIHKRAAICRHIVDTISLVRIQSQSNFNRGWGMIMEFCSGGDLFSLIIKPGWKRTPIAEKYCLFKQVAYGLKFLHDHDIVHRDMKPENVLIDSNGLAKLCDFGVSAYGHVIPGDFTSDVHLSCSYVGSPPYSPPEVMLLKDKTHTQAKSFPYNTFKMDHWGLGMLLFCLIYSGVPFSHSSPNDHAFREYNFSHKRFCTDHHAFKNNVGYPRGPGSEFKLAAKFESTGAARVAWKLCDPSPETRYDLDLLFNDPWFQSLEMCIYEHPDQLVNPFVLPGTGENPTVLPQPGSGYSSAPGSAVPSRKGTINAPRRHKEEDYPEYNTSIRSMLDLDDSPSSASPAPSKPPHPPQSQPQPQQGDKHPIHTTTNNTPIPHSLFLHQNPKLETEMRAESNSVPLPKIKSMLEFGPVSPSQSPVMGGLPLPRTPSPPMNVQPPPSLLQTISGSRGGSGPTTPVSPTRASLPSTALDLNLGNGLSAVEEVGLVNEVLHEEDEEEEESHEEDEEPKPDHHEGLIIPEPKIEEKVKDEVEEGKVTPNLKPEEEEQTSSSRSTPIQKELSSESNSDKELKPPVSPSLLAESSSRDTNTDVNTLSSGETAITRFKREIISSKLEHDITPLERFGADHESTLLQRNISSSSLNYEQILGSHPQSPISNTELLLGPKEYRSAEDLVIDKDGMCELGYKIKKHHHTEVSNVAVSGSMSRRR
ncbi:PTK2 [[Candida] subhashii]|uniref:non-specific serine/threonine protein kinase n=1 Tax=[Candida] subhashii TaxID=561895 RepID=A0A8J5UJ54_9ASCO|nr:PTK2 [[Candida] subhashii]KAG7660826.1 PTK2 [[Candida] subhashii]